MTSFGGANEAGAVAPERGGSTRMARCCSNPPVPSDPALAFFVDCGPGSEEALTSCKHCGYKECAHDSTYMARNVPSNRRTVVEQGKCPGFEAHGPYDFDRYYCGCQGWD